MLMRAAGRQLVLSGGRKNQNGARDFKMAETANSEA